MNLKKILNKEATWYFLTLAGLLILLYMGGNIIIDTHFYVISLNILIFLFSYIIVKIKNKLHYYSYVVGCAFFVVWLIFYSICDLRSRSLKGYLTKQLPISTSLQYLLKQFVFLFLLIVTIFVFRGLWYEYFCCSNQICSSISSVPCQVINALACHSFGLL